MTPRTLCRYKDYREPPWSEHKYDISKDFWAVLAARLAFVIVFQVCLCVSGMSVFRKWRGISWEVLTREGELTVAGDVVRDPEEGADPPEPE